MHGRLSGLPHSEPRFGHEAVSDRGHGDQSNSKVRGNQPEYLGPGWGVEAQACGLSQRRLRTGRDRSDTRRSGCHRASTGGGIRARHSAMKLRVEAERWPYRTPFRISRGVEDALDVLVVTLRDERGHLGRGEAAGVDYAGETIDTM